MPLPAPAFEKKKKKKRQVVDPENPDRVIFEDVESVDSADFFKNPLDKATPWYQIPQHKQVRA